MLTIFFHSQYKLFCGWFWLFVIWMFLLYPFLEFFTRLWSIFESWQWFVIFHFIFVDCSPGGAKFLAWKAMNSHFAGTPIFLGLFLETASMLSFAGGRFVLHWYFWTLILVLS